PCRRQAADAQQFIFVGPRRRCELHCVLDFQPDMPWKIRNLGKKIWIDVAHRGGEFGTELTGLERPRGVMQRLAELLKRFGARAAGPGADIREQLKVNAAMLRILAE